MPEQMNLSNALDLIAQSKTDIKASVENKGGTIGNDLTEYGQSIDNIQFIYLSSECFNNTIYVETPEEASSCAIYIYDNNTHQNVDIDPSEITVSISPTLIQDLSESNHLIYEPTAVTVTKDYLWTDLQRGTAILLEQGGTAGRTNIIVHYGKGNMDYVFTAVPHNQNIISTISNVTDDSGTPISFLDDQILCNPNTTMRIYPSVTINGTPYTLSTADNINLDWVNPGEEEIPEPYTVTWDDTNKYLELIPNAVMSNYDNVGMYISWNNPNRDISGYINPIVGNKTH